MNDQSFVKTRYPFAWEDSKNTIWATEGLGRFYQTAADLMESDLWCEYVLGWSWEDAAQNLRDCMKDEKRGRWRMRHPRLTSFARWFRLRYRFWSLFVRLCSPPEPLSVALAWSISRDLWAKTHSRA